MDEGLMYLEIYMYYQVQTNYSRRGYWTSGMTLNYIWLYLKILPDLNYQELFKITAECYWVEIMLQVQKKEKNSDELTIDCFDTAGNVIVNSIKHWFCILMVVIILKIFNLKVFSDIF